MEHIVCMDVENWAFDEGISMRFQRRARKAIIVAILNSERLHRHYWPQTQRSLKKALNLRRSDFRRRTFRRPRLGSEHEYSTNIWLAGIDNCGCRGRAAIRRIDRVCRPKESIKRRYVCIPADDPILRKRVL